MRPRLLLIGCAGLVATGCLPPWPTVNNDALHRAGRRQYSLCGRLIGSAAAHEAVAREPSSRHDYQRSKDLEIGKLGTIPFVLFLGTYVSGIPTTLVSSAKKAASREGEIVGGSLLGVAGASLVAVISMLDWSSHYDDRAIADYNANVHCQDGTPVSKSAMDAR